MTALRPERDSASPYGEPYGEAGAFEAAVERLDDPLNDPLPGQGPASDTPGVQSGQGSFPWVPLQDRGEAPAPAAGYSHEDGYEPYGGEHAYPRDDASSRAYGAAQEGWRGTEQAGGQISGPDPYTYGSGEPYGTYEGRGGGEPFGAAEVQGSQGTRGAYDTHRGFGTSQGYEDAPGPRSSQGLRNTPGLRNAQGLDNSQGRDSAQAYDATPQGATADRIAAIRQAARQAVREAADRSAADQDDAGATAVMPTVSTPQTGSRGGGGAPSALPRIDEETVALRVPDGLGGDEAGASPPGGGRAARRKAAKGKRNGGHRARGRRPGDGASGEDAPAPASRMEARRQAKARKDPPSVVASRLVGELFISIGVLMLLFVAYQLWYTNVLAHAQAGGAADSLQRGWDSGGDGAESAGAFEPGQGFAILYIPKLDVKVPIAEGIDKHKVLDRGMAGHYAKTAMPWEKKGNFSVAGHRNTHGEPFRYINKLEPGDKIIVEVKNAFYTYEMANILPQTPPSNVSVIDPVPNGSGFTKPGRYLTLTTCTPEFTSTYRMIVWGKMVDERPRSEGKPAELSGG
ncbi:class E sortase [Streptomyces sp. NPDC047108]|uniref:class E sortase n=1 Tax=Streptomyces sp. NPDC047108 TaxID=3155025 RepID=UPI0033D82F51